MVIQRIWRTSQSIETSSTHQTSSSEDSNSSWNTMSNSTSSRDNRINNNNNLINNSNNNGNVSNMNSNNGVNNETSSSNNHNQSTKTLNSSSLSNSEMAESVLKALKNRYNGRTSMQQTAADLAFESIETMRVNIQDMFDKEIDVIVRKYVDTYFQPALKNVKENLGDAALTDDYMNKISVNLLEKSKQLYTPKIDDFLATPIKIEPVTIKSEFPTLPDHHSYTLKTGPCKRKDSTSSSSEVSSSDQSPTHHIVKRLPTNFQIKTITRPKQVFWNVSSITSDTLFILDYKANRALGFIENHRDRLTNQHPELVRYLTDNQDKDWLIQHKILPPTYKHFRVLLLVLGEVCKIAQSDSYRGRHTLKLNELVGFKLPDFMMFKLKTFFNDLTHKSQNLLLGPSFIIANGATTFSLVPTTATTSITNADELISSTSSGVGITTTALSSATNVIATTTGVRTELPRIMQIKIAGRSSLSSSHATLSALLSSSDSAGNPGQMTIETAE